MKLKVSKYVADKIKRTKKDFDVTACRASGPGGQNVNKVNTAIRITDKQTGISVFCQEHKSQGQNKSAAFLRLGEKLVEYYKREEFNQIIEGTHESQGWIRTYREKGDTVIDKRLPGRIFSYSKTLNGDMIGLVEELLITSIGGEDVS